MSSSTTGAANADQALLLFDRIWLVKQSAFWKLHLQAKFCRDNGIDVPGDDNDGAAGGGGGGRGGRGRGRGRRGRGGRGRGGDRAPRNQDGEDQNGEEANGDKAEADGSSGMQVGSMVPLSAYVESDLSGQLNIVFLAFFRLHIVELSSYCKALRMLYKLTTVSL